MEIGNLDTELADGVNLHALLEILGETTITPAPKPSKMKIQKVESLNRLLNHIKAQNIKLVGIGAEGKIESVVHSWSRHSRR
jgi:hypothetical protein